MRSLVPTMLLALIAGCSAVLDFDPFREGADGVTDAGPTDAGDSGTSARDATTDSPSGDAGLLEDCEVRGTDDDLDGVIDEGCGDGIAGVSAANQHTCAFAGDGRAWCWGHNASGQLGNAVAGTDEERPVRVDVLETVTSIAAGRDHTCAVDDMSTWCWGGNGIGQCVNGGTSSGGPTPSETVDEGAMGAGAPAVSLTAGDFHTCDVREDGLVRCGGDDEHGKLGLGPPTGDPIPRLTEVTPVAGAIHVSAGRHHTCAVTSSGELWCWGYDDLGQVGTTTVMSTVPVEVPIRDREIAQVAAGGRHTCAVTTSGELWCWGENDEGQLGRGDAETSRHPEAVLVPLPDTLTAQQVTAGFKHTCVVTTAATLYCWGANVARQLGTGSSAPRETTPTAVVAPDGVYFATVSAGEAHTCAVATSGDLYCWGHNANGQLGIGSRETASLPARVTF